MMIRWMLLLLATLWSAYSMECHKKSSCSCVTKTEQETNLSPFRGTYFVANKESNGTKIEYRYYPCDILADWGELACTVKEKASVCLKNTTHKGVTKYATISTQDTIKFRVINTEPYTTEVSYRTGTETTTIELQCTSGIETQGDTFIQLASSTIHHLKFSLVSKHVCPIQLVLPYNNPPVLFILLCVLGGVILLVYFMSGVFYQFCVKGARGIELVPNLEFWKETPSLFRDGFLFVFSCYRPFKTQFSNVI